MARGIVHVADGGGQPLPAGAGQLPPRRPPSCLLAACRWLSSQVVWVRPATQLSREKTCVTDDHLGNSAAPCLSVPHNQLWLYLWAGCTFFGRVVELSRNSTPSFLKHIQSCIKHFPS